MRLCIYSKNESISDDLLGVAEVDPLDLLDETLLESTLTQDFDFSVDPIAVYSQPGGDISGYVEIKTCIVR